MKERYQKIVFIIIAFGCINAANSQNIIANVIGFFFYIIQNPYDICKALAIYTNTAANQNIEQIVNQSVHIYCINSAT